MAITPPSWAKNAVPTPNGWQDPRSGELLKSQRIGQADIDAYNGVTAPAPVAPAPTPVATVEIEEEVMQQLNEALSTPRAIIAASHSKQYLTKPKWIWPIHQVTDETTDGI